MQKDTCTYRSHLLNYSPVMAKSKSKRVLVGMVSVLTGHRIYTRKNTLNTPEPLELKKYDPLARKIATYKETKKNLGRNEVKAKKR